VDVRSTRKSGSRRGGRVELTLGSNTGKLVQLPSLAGTPHWNVLCRWAFCLSLKQASPPAPLDVPADSNVEMTWQVFGGDAHEIYLALLEERCERDGLCTSEDVLARQLRLHLHRGIGYLAAPQMIRSVSDLIRLVAEESGGDA
jgi:DNA sulfur modification protein DndE